MSSILYKVGVLVGRNPKSAAITLAVLVVVVIGANVVSQYQNEMRLETIKNEREAERFGLTVEEYFIELKKSQKLKFTDFPTYIEAKNFGLLDPIEFEYAKSLGRTLVEWNKDKVLIKSSNQSVESYVKNLKEDMRVSEEITNRTSELSSQEFKEFQRTLAGVQNSLNREEVASQKIAEDTRARFKREALSKKISNQHCEFLGVRQYADQYIYCYAKVGFGFDGSKVAYVVNIDSENVRRVGEIYPEDKFTVYGEIRKITYALENTKWVSGGSSVKAGDAIIEIKGRVERR